MSLVTRVVVYHAAPRDVHHINAWLAKNDTERQQQLMRLDTEAAGGTKEFRHGVWAAALNYAPEGLIPLLKDPKTWDSSPLGVTVVIDGESSHEVILIKDVESTGELYAAISRMER